MVILFDPVNFSELFQNLNLTHSKKTGKRAVWVSPGRDIRDTTQN